MIRFLGRFISKDSYEGSISNPLSLNRYSYCAGNPVEFNDPSGHEYRWIREMAAEVGATVKWDEKTRSAIITYQGKETVYSIDYVHARIINNRMYIDDASFICAIGAFWDSSLEKIVSNNSPAGNAVEAVRGRELFTGRSLSEAEQIAKGEKASNLLMEGAIFMGAGGVKKGSAGKSFTRGLTPKNINRVDDNYLIKKGFNPHKLKEDLVGRKKVSQYDIYVNKDTGELWIYRKGGIGEGMSTGEYIK